jgi:hypothetical protein
MYATTGAFLEVFGLRDLDALPDLEEFKELQERAAQEEESAAPAPASEEVPSGGPAGDSGEQISEAGDPDTGTPDRSE